MGQERRHKHNQMKTEFKANIQCFGNKFINLENMDDSPANHKSPKSSHEEVET